MEVSGFDDVDEALSKAQGFLKVPLADAYRLEPERINLRSDWGEPGGTNGPSHLVTRNTVTV